MRATSRLLPSPFRQPDPAPPACPWYSVSGVRLLGLLICLCGGALSAAAQPVPPPPVQPLPEVLRDADDDGVPDQLGRLVTTAGRVSTPVMAHAEGSQDFFIQSGGAGLDIIIPQRAVPPVLGDSVIVTGVLSLEAGMQLLEDAVFQAVPGPTRLPEPVRLGDTPPASWQSYEGRLVTVDGTVIDHGRTGEGLYLLLKLAAGTPLNVFIFRTRATHFDLNDVQPGDPLRVTGIVGQYDDAPPYDAGYQLFPRFPDDIRPRAFFEAYHERVLLIGLILLLVAGAWGLTLRRQVRSRTQALRRSEASLRQYARQLEAARAEAEAATQAKSRFLANVSHEIRTPMHAILGFSDLLMETRLSPDQQEFARVIRSNADTLLGLLNDLLDASKYEAGELELEAEPFALRPCLEAALDLVAPRAAVKGLTLAYFAEPDVPEHVVGDATRFRQILSNLLSNAVKFTEAGEVYLAVQRAAPEAAAPEADGCLLHVSVHDTGIGIPADRVDRLFKSFSQVDASTTRRYGGTGLGLSICKHLSEAMGGRVWVESEEGAGSTFHVLLRLDVDDSRTADAEAERAEAAVASLQGRRLLVVDGHARSREVLARQMQPWPVEVTEATSAQAALQALAAGPCDLILLDAELHTAEGLSLADALAALYPALPLVVMTPLGAAEAAPRRFAAALTKPVHLSRLGRTLAQALEAGNRPQWSPPEVPEADADADGAETEAVLPLRILVAEDNPDNQELIRHVLQRLHCRPDIVANGAEVLACLEEHTYDLILLDLHMPVMGGLETARHIREYFPPSECPLIVAVSADLTEEAEQACREAGMIDFIGKPFRLRRFTELLQRVARIET